LTTVSIATDKNASLKEADKELRYKTLNMGIQYTQSMKPYIKPVLTGESLGEQKGNNTMSCGHRLLFKGTQLNKLCRPA
jgi:hypothetical protein